MVDEVLGYINKKVAITLINGKERTGIITGVDTGSNSIKLKDESGNQVSLLISMIGMLEPFVDLNGIEKNESIINQNQWNKISKSDINLGIKIQETIQKITKLEILYETEIRNAILTVSKPDFETPVDIKKITYTAISEEGRQWNNIKNKYDSSVKLGRLLPNSDDLRAITNLAIALSENPKLSDSATIQSYLGYFYYLNKSKVESIKAYQKAAKLSNKPQEWLNFAAIAIEKEEYELGCLALEKLFSNASCTEGGYEKAWYKFVELVIRFSAYSSIKPIIEKGLLKSEHEKIFEALCFCLLKNGENKIVENQVLSSFSNENFKLLALDSLIYLPQQPIPSYLSIKLEFNKKVDKSLDPKVQKPQVSRNNLSTFYKNKYVDTLREARTARDISKDYEKAEKLFIEGIEKEYNQTIKQGAIRDLASMLAQQMNQPQKAIDVIEKYQDTHTDSDLNLLYTFSFQLGEYEEAIRIQKELLKNTQRKDQRVSRYNLLASCYFRLAKYEEAIQNYKNALKITPSNYSFKRNIALCQYQQGNIDISKKILNEIIEEFGDVNAQKLLDKIEGRDTNPIEDFLIDTTGLVFENIDFFTTYFLQACDLKYIDKSRLSDDKKYIGNEENKRFDIRKLEDAASTLRSRIAEERSNIYLNASRILFDLGEQENDFYKYLCRSFTSKGDNAIQINNSIDTVQTYYLAALKIHDALYLDAESTQRREEQDAINAVCRYLYSFLGRDKIPLNIGGGSKNLAIKETIDNIFSISENVKVLNALPLLFARSPQFVMNKILQIITGNSTLKNLIIRHFGYKDGIDNAEFAGKWKSEAKRIIKIENEISEQLVSLRNFQISEIWLSNNKEKVKQISSKVLFNSDKDYLLELEQLFDSAISLCRAIDHDEKNNKLDDFQSKTEIFLKKIEKNPTKLSIEEIYSIAQSMLIGLDLYRKELFTKSKPELNITNVFSSYQLKNGNKIDLQVKIENKAEGHAEEVELFIETNSIYMNLNPNAVFSFNTIRGFSDQVKIVELDLTDKAIQEKAFSLKVRAKFKNRLNEEFETNVENLPIQIGEQKDFIELKPNPYANGASGRAVTNEEMFFGRDKYIESAYKTMVEDGISYVIYGQFRSGKSSVLTHLEKKLEDQPQIIVAKLGDIGTFMGGESGTPMFYRFLHRILKSLETAFIKKQSETGMQLISFNVPDSRTFYQHPSPEDYFYEIMDYFYDQKTRLHDWQKIRVIVSMDEFTYIFEQIVKGKLSPDFMKSWKALLAKDYFNVVLVAQDVFPKFFAQYENAFGTIYPKRITYLDSENAKLLIDSPIKKLNKNESKFKENAIDKIIDLTAGHPWYIQIFCNALVNYINQDKQIYITGANIDIVKESLLRGTDRKDNFKNFIENGDPSPDRIHEKDFTKVLKKIAEYTKNDEYCAHNLLVNCATEFPLNQILKDLESRDVISTHGEKGYKIRVGLFKEWLNENPNVWE